MTQLDESRLGDLIVVRLCARTKKPPAPSSVSRTLQGLLARQLSASEWREVFGAALEQLRRAGLVQPKQLVLTDAGQRRARAVLRLKAPPKARGWRELKAKYLPRLLFPLDLPEGATLSPIAAVLAERLGVPIGARTDVAQVVRIAVMAASGATSCRAEAVTSALVARWLLQATPRVAAATKPGHRAPAASTLEHVIEKVRRASSSAGVRQYGAEKVFIASVWEALAGDAEIAALGERGFKEALAEAHRRGLITLSRADLVAAMDARDVAASEIRHHNATYHFIQRGASA